MYDEELAAAAAAAGGSSRGAARRGSEGRGGEGGPPPRGGPRTHPAHWYDEPPYESDPEDFLIGKDAYRWVFGTDPMRGHGVRGTEGILSRLGRALIIRRKKLAISIPLPVLRA